MSNWVYFVTRQGIRIEICRTQINRKGTQRPPPNSPVHKWEGTTNGNICFIKVKSKYTHMFEICIRGSLFQSLTLQFLWLGFIEEKHRLVLTQRCQRPTGKNVKFSCSFDFDGGSDFRLLLICILLECFKLRFMVTTIAKFAFFLLTTINNHFKINISLDVLSCSGSIMYSVGPERMIIHLVQAQYSILTGAQTTWGQHSG